MSLRINICSNPRRMKLSVSNCLIGAFHLDASSTLPEPIGKRAANGVRVAADSAFPDDRNAPAATHQGRNRHLVALLVAPQFLVPEIGAGLGEPEVGTTSMAMPKAAMHKHHRLPSGQNQVRSSWQPFGVQAISETSAPEPVAHQQLRSGALAPYT